METYTQGIILKTHHPTFYKDQSNQINRGIKRLYYVFKT